MNSDGEGHRPRLMIISSPSSTGDQDAPPTLKGARGGALGAIRNLHKKNEWPEGLDLLVISDIYGLVEPLNPEDEPAPIPLTRADNPDWWNAFVSRNLDNRISRRGYREALVIARPEHEQAFRMSGKLSGIETKWSNLSAGTELLKKWIAGSGDVEDTVPPLRLVGSDSVAGKGAKSRRTNGVQDRQETQAIPQPEEASDLPPGAIHLVQDAIYTDRFMLVVSKLSENQLSQMRHEINAAWSVRRSARRRDRPSVSNIVTRSARLPWAERPAATFYNRLLENIGILGVLGSINKAVAQLEITEPGRYRDILSRLSRDETEFLTDLLYLLWEASSRMDKEEMGLLRAFLTDTATHSELRRMGMPRNLALEDRYELLRAVLDCFRGFTLEGALSEHRRVWIWLHEVENVLGYPEHDRWQLVKGLETLFAHAPSYVTVWMNISEGSSMVTGWEIGTVLENNLRITDDLTSSY